jgi:hypothetical protein
MCGERAERQIDREIEENADLTGGAVEEVKAAVLRSEVAEIVGTDLARERLEMWTAEASLERIQGEQEILKWISGTDVPRRVKRMINQLRLMVLVADNRRMLVKATPALQGAHLGKWVVMLERWPELSRAVREDPELMRVIETAADKEPAHEPSDSFRQELAAIAPQETGTRALVSFLQDEIKLSPVIKRLVYCLPPDQAEPAVEVAPVTYALPSLTT